MEDDAELPKTLVKLRRTPSDTPRPASTPPVIVASAIQDEDEEEKIIAELEVGSGDRGQRSGVGGRRSEVRGRGSAQTRPVTHVVNVCAADISENACKRPQ